MKNVPLNPGVKRSAEQRRCSVPVVLRTTAPAYANRYTAPTYRGGDGDVRFLPRAYATATAT